MNAKVVGGLGDRLTVTVICPRLSTRICRHPPANPQLAALQPSDPCLNDKSQVF